MKVVGKMFRWSTPGEAYAYETGYIEGIADAKQWIPMTTQLPDKGVSVLISHVGDVYEDYLDIDDGDLYFMNSGLLLEEEKNNMAWMPLPKPWKGD